MKKILILAYEFPPYISVGGQRAESWYNFFRINGLYPVVVTRQWRNRFGDQRDYIDVSETNTVIIEEGEKGTVIRSPYFPSYSNKILLKNSNWIERKIQKWLSAFTEVFQFFGVKGPKFPIFTAADAYLKINKVDCILATGDPFVLFKYADKLSKKYSIPWFADYRDNWSNDISIKSQLLSKIYTIAEKRILRRVSGAFTVSTLTAGFVLELKRDLFMSVIFNGYNDDLPEVVGEQINNGVLNIGFAGTIYDWNPLELLITYLAKVWEDCRIEFKLNLYGINDVQRIKDVLLLHPELKEKVIIHPKISPIALKSVLLSQNVLLLFNYYAFMGSKIFEYLPLRRKVILCFEGNPEAEDLKKRKYTVNLPENAAQNLQTELLRETGCGIVLSNYASFKIALLNLDAELKNMGYIACETAEIQKFARSNQAKLMAEIILSKIEKRS